MSRQNAEIPLLDEALASWLEHAPESTEREIVAPPILQRARTGHSPSARAVVNAGDVVVAAAGALGDGQLKRSRAITLKQRIVQSAERALKGGGSPVAVLPPNEVVARLHVQTEDPRRLELIERLGARGAALAGVGQLATDHALERLLEQVWPFLGFDVVLVSIVVGPETIHRVHRGFPVSFGNVDSVPRELSYCTHTVSAGETLVVEDATREAFFRRSMLVQKLGARSYLGVPLFSEIDGAKVALGALCGISLTARSISDEDVALTRCFARVAEALVTHDEGALATLIDDPKGYPTAEASAQNPAVYSSEQFQSLVDAERARAGATRLLRADKEAWARLSALVVPNGLVTGELADSFRGLLIPKLARFEPSVETALAALESELL